MHDVVAHSLSVVIAQADGGRYAADTDPGAARQALETVAITGRQALAEMRLLLGVLRTGAPDGDRPDLDPLPGLDRLDELVAQLRAAGLPVDLRVDGPAHALTRPAVPASPSCRPW